MVDSFEAIKMSFRLKLATFSVTLKKSWKSADVWSY